MMQPPRMTVAVPKVVLNGGGRAGPPGAINVDPPVDRGVQTSPVCGWGGRCLDAVGERGQDRTHQVQPGQMDHDTLITS